MVLLQIMDIFCNYEPKKRVINSINQWHVKGVDDSTPVRGVPYEPSALLGESVEPRLSQIPKQLPAEFIPLTLEETNPITLKTKL